MRFSTAFTLTMSPSPPLRLAINGFGRIGRCFLRALHESGLGEELRVVAINEPAERESIAYLTRFDSTHGRFPGRVELAGGDLFIDGQRIAMSHGSTPEQVNWRELDIDLLIECSGQYAYRHQLEAFLHAGCPRLLLSHPGHRSADVDATLVYGFNEHLLGTSERLVSSASCTTNAIVPVMNILHRDFGVEHAMLTSLHSLMNDQPVLDGFHHADLRCTRSALQSIIPVATGLARGVERLLPALSGRLQAKAIRVPILNVSAIDMVLTLARDVSVDEINHRLRDAASEFPGLLAYSEDPHASIDFNHYPQSAIVDACQTRISGGRLANVMLWFDNEWGYANRMLDIARHWRKILAPARTVTP